MTFNAVQAAYTNFNLNLMLQTESDTTSIIVNDPGEEDFEIEPASVKSKGITTETE